MPVRLATLRGFARISKMMGVSSHGICKRSVLEMKRTRPLTYSKMCPFIKYFILDPVYSVIVQYRMENQRVKRWANTPRVFNCTMTAIN